MDGARLQRLDEPACFVDLNLDQVLGAVVAQRDRDVLLPIFYATYRNEEIIRYRQAIFADIKRAEVFQTFVDFREAMRAVRANLAYAAELSLPAHRNLVLLRGIGAYCGAVQSLLERLRSLAPRSTGLRNLRDYLAGYVDSPSFTSLATGVCDVRTALAGITYGMLFREAKVTVRAYTSEPDYAATIRERFARFRVSPDAPLASPRRWDDFSLNHIEQGILALVGRLFPKPFQAAADYVLRHREFLDDVILTLDREVGFFLAYAAYVRPLEDAGLPFCDPDVSASDKTTAVSGSFDLALAAKLVKEGRPIVRNDFHLSGAERVIVVSGPNQGGKTTFARMFGQVHVLAGLGCPIPGETARIFLPDRVLTHFEREEKIESLRGKLEDELVRLRNSLDAMTPHSVIVLNEIFGSTSLDDQVFMSTKVLQRILSIDALGLCVTFIDALSKLSEKTVSMVSTVVPDDPARRTFKVLRRPADGLAYALSLAEKHGVTYERLRARIRP